MRKLRIFLLFGGKSTEHEVSLASAKSIYQALDKDLYDVECIGITKAGSWIRGPDAKAHLLSAKPIVEKGISLNVSDSFTNVQPKGQALAKNVRPEYVIFPVLHGRYGEDGLIQGMFEIGGSAYVGSGVLSSALGMDKVKQKEIMTQYKIPVVPFYWFYGNTWARKRKTILQGIEKKFDGSYPLFVKPANTGSSVGIVKAHTEEELINAIELARSYDLKVIIEKGVPQIREIEVSCMGNEDVETSVCGEVIPANEFYDYDAKYSNEKTKILIPAPLSNAVASRIQDMARRAYKAMDCAGLARADFFLSGKDTIFFNEINTIPGFTNMSMYPKLWEASGVSFPKLLDKLINLAIQRWRERMAIETER